MNACLILDSKSYAIKNGIVYKQNGIDWIIVSGSDAIAVKQEIGE